MRDICITCDTRTERNDLTQVFDGHAIGPDGRKKTGKTNERTKTMRNNAKRQTNGEKKDEEEEQDGKRERKRERV